MTRINLRVSATFVLRWIVAHIETIARWSGARRIAAGFVRSQWKVRSEGLRIVFFGGAEDFALSGQSGTRCFDCNANLEDVDSILDAVRVGQDALDKATSLSASGSSSFYRKARPTFLHVCLQIPSRRYTSHAIFYNI